MASCICCCHTKHGLSRGTGDTSGTRFLPEHSCLAGAKRWDPPWLSGFTSSSAPTVQKIKYTFGRGTFAYVVLILENDAKLVLPAWRTRLTLFEMTTLSALMSLGSHRSWEILLCEQHFFWKPFKCSSSVSTVLCHVAWAWGRAGSGRSSKGQAGKDPNFLGIFQFLNVLEWLLSCGSLYLGILKNTQFFFRKLTNPDKNTNSVFSGPEMGRRTVAVSPHASSARPHAAGLRRHFLFGV